MFSLDDSFNALRPDLPWWLYCSAFVLFIYGVHDALETRRLVQKHAQLPVVGGALTLFIPKSLLNLLYAWNATSLAQVGYNKVRFIKPFTGPGLTMT